jgi:hypothetical protein
MRSPNLYILGNIHWLRLDLGHQWIMKYLQARQPRSGNIELVIRSCQHIIDVKRRASGD